MPYNGMGMPMNTGIAPTKRSIIDFICLNTQCSSYVLVDEFESLRARHICPAISQKNIWLLEKDTIPVPTTKGMIGVEVFFCPYCRKLYINKSSLEII